MTVDTTELRTRARLIKPGFPGTAAAVVGAADEIDALRSALAEVPHSTVCAYMTSLHGEPCSCAKSVLPAVAVTGTVTTSYPDVHRLTVAGPHGRVLGLLAIADVRIDIDDHHLTISYTNP